MLSEASEPKEHCASSQAMPSGKYRHALHLVQKRNATGMLRKQSDRVLLPISPEHAVVLFTALDTGHLEAERHRSFIAWLTETGKAYMLVCMCHGGTKAGDALCLISVVAPIVEKVDDQSTKIIRKLHFRRQSKTHLVRTERRSPEGEPLYEFAR